MIDNHIATKKMKGINEEEIGRCLAEDSLITVVTDVVVEDKIYDIAEQFKNKYKEEKTGSRNLVNEPFKVTVPQSYGFKPSDEEVSIPSVAHKDNSNYVIIPINDFKQIYPTLDCGVVEFITSKKKIKDIEADEFVQSFDEKTGKIVANRVNELVDMGNKTVYELRTESGRSINTTSNHPYLVKPTNFEDLTGDDLNLRPSFNSIKNPSKSSGLDLSLSNLENEFINDSILRCGILNQTIENIFSLENSAKSSSLVTNTLCSDLENSASLPFESPFGFETASAPCCSRNLFNLSSTFSSRRNLSLDWDVDNDILFTSSQISRILQSCFNMLLSQRMECLKDFFKRGSIFQHLQNLPDHYSSSFESGLSMANFTVRNDEFVNFNSHETNNSNVVFKDYDNQNIAQSIEAASFFANITNATLTGLRIRSSALESKSEVPSSSARNTSSDYTILPIDEFLECDKYSNSYWNKKDENINYISNLNNDVSINEFEQKGYCTIWVEVSELKENMEVAVPRIDASQDIFFMTSPVVKQSIGNFLKRFSYDQSGQPSSRASAIYGASFLCSPSNDSASGSRAINLSKGITAIFFSSNISSMSNSVFENRDLAFSSLECFLTSLNKSSGVHNSSLGEKSMSTDLPATKNEQITLASTANNIYPSSFFLYALYSPSVTLLPIANASFSVSFDLDTIDLKSLNSATFSAMAARAISDQLSSGNFSISSFMSLGIANVNVGIVSPLSTHSIGNIVYYVQIFKPFGIDAESDIFFEKITSIKPLDKQHVYGLNIENTHNFIANDFNQLAFM
ncbi:MAG: hypothetical protein AABX33_06295 [Nanoarchaeota archaeon]